MSPPSSHRRSGPRTTWSGWSTQSGTLDPAEYLAGILNQTIDRCSALGTLERVHEAAGVQVPEDYLGLEGQELELGL